VDNAGLDRLAGDILSPPPLPPKPRVNPTVGLVVAGKVRLEQLLGKGGMGSVWRGTHLTLGTPVAVKFMADSNPEALARFQREAQVAAQIRSSNVVAIHDFGVEDGLPYITMELLEGEDLGVRLKRVQRLSIAEAVEILVPVSRGLERAHAAKLVHRDLKPENIFLVRDGDEEVPKILDFGIAKTLLDDPESLQMTRDGAVLGTPYYMSPEQARAQRDVDHRADLWALGVILFRAITGRRPFEGLTAAALAVKICTEPAPRVVAVHPELSSEWDVFFDRALAKDPAQRFQSAREMAQSFAQVAGQSMQLGRTPTPSWSGVSTGPLGLSSPLAGTGPTGPPIEHAIVEGTPVKSNRRTSAIIAATTLLVVVGGLLVFWGQRSKNAGQREPSLAQSTITAATPTLPPVDTALIAVPEPSADVVELIDSATPPVAETATKSPAKTGKPAVSATKKRSRDLGY
jgi:eukaryotic-like serine/threonine-protein kinase